jgi:hypothetical protein
MPPKRTADGATTVLLCQYTPALHGCTAIGTAKPGRESAGRSGTGRLAVQASSHLRHPPKTCGILARRWSMMRGEGHSRAIGRFSSPAPRPDSTCRVGESSDAGRISHRATSSACRGGCPSAEVGAGAVLGSLPVSCPPSRHGARPASRVNGACRRRCAMAQAPPWTRPPDEQGGSYEGQTSV